MALGVGLIGSGYMGKCHALAWNSVAPVFGDVDRPRLVALADATQALAEKHARAFGFAMATSNWRDLLTDPQVDVISITAPNQFHPEMAVAALEAGKHVWCEKPMATALEDAQRMLVAAHTSGKVAVLGYNYIQNPLIRQAKALIDAGRIGTINHIRLEMDEDYMADPTANFYWKSEKSSGYGAPDDFAVHPLSLLFTLVGPVTELVADMAKPYAMRPTKDGVSREVENFDIAHTIFRGANGVSGVLMVNRSAWGRKGRIAFQIYGSTGSILYDQERMNEIQLFTSADATAEQGFRTILSAPVHPPYDKFIPAPGHGLGFNELKMIEARELMRKIAGGPAHVIDFQTGFEIEKVVHAIAKSHEARGWIAL